MDQNNQQMKSQMDEIAGYYKDLMQQAIREKGEALVQLDIAKARVSALEAERDSLQEALKSADQRIRELEIEHAAGTPQMQVPVEPAPMEMPEAAPVTPAPMEMPEVEHVELAPVEMPEVAPVEPAPTEVPEPDFEEQKEALRRMEAELAALEERMKKGS